MGAKRPKIQMRLAFDAARTRVKPARERAEGIRSAHGDARHRTPGINRGVDGGGVRAGESEAGTAASARATKGAPGVDGMTVDAITGAT